MEAIIAKKWKHCLPPQELLLLESSETIRQNPYKLWKKIWPTPYGDIGINVNYNGPKVESLP
jgi:hypothetical protein